MKRKLMVGLLAAVLAMPLVAQNDQVMPELSKKEAKKLAKKQAKEEARMRDEVNYQRAKTAIEMSAFVLEADQLSFKKGNPVQVTPTINFISLADGKAFVQIASASAFYQGVNGMGGISVAGDYRMSMIKVDKKGNVLCSFKVSGPVISAQIDVTLFAGSDRAEAIVLPNFSSKRLTMRGRIVPAEQSDIFKSGRYY